MRISREQAQENKGKVLAAASELFRCKGFDGVAVGEIMKAAGFTHGGFYNHFESKEALAKEALAEAWDAMARERERAADLPALFGAYLSDGARRAPGKACPAAALAGDVARQPESVKAAFAAGLEGMIASVAKEVAGEPGIARERAVAIVARMVGALVLSRAVPDRSPLSRELLLANRSSLSAEVATAKKRRST